MSIGGQQEALRAERDKLASDYAKLGKKYAALLKKHGEILTAFQEQGEDLNALIVVAKEIGMTIERRPALAGWALTNFRAVAAEKRLMELDASTRKT